MSKRSGFILWGAVCWLLICGSLTGTEMRFDQAQWQTGDMNEQAPADSSGSIANSNVDYFYYYERMPMRMAVIDDSLAAGSSRRRYDSAVLTLVVAQTGVSGNDSMMVFARRLTRNWSENGVSWSYFWGSSDSSWTTPGGDVNSERCSDTIMVDAAMPVYDTLILHLDTGFVRFMIETANYGWLMTAVNKVDRFPLQLFTEDCATPAYRPVLTVYYAETTPAAGGHRRRVVEGGLP
ncbi:MAG: hypothetical protein PHR28_12895 [candidate division Zixibacteria bacterium]|nr:hypothetical protein [candidate division Zixibacteria bacterium]